jgi:hypothetical protein
VLVDGLTTIQSALNSEGYQRKATNRIRQARLMTDLTWARQGLKGNQVDSFYEKKEKQDIQSSERAMVSVLHCVPRARAQLYFAYPALSRRSLYSALALATENSAWRAGQRVARPLKHW